MMEANITSSQLPYFCFGTEKEIIVKIQMEYNAISDYLFIEKVLSNSLKLQSSGNHVIDPASSSYLGGSCNLLVLIQITFFNLTTVTFLSSR